MTGIGEIGAIITIAEVGLNFSTALIGYVGDVRGAGSRIQAIADEINSTSGQLKELGELVKRNGSTQLFSEEGLKRSQKLAAAFKVAIDEIRDVLKKVNVCIDPDSVGNDEIEVSRFSKFSWPLFQSKLAVPRAELARLKTDLLLLYTSVKVAGA